MKTILVALDGAPSASEVLAQAAALAEATHARLILMRTPDVPARPLDAGVDEQRFTERIHAELRRELEAQRRSLPATLDCTLKVEMGPAAESICAAARESEAELIVIGAHGMGAMTGALGAVARKVLESADRNVLVVKGRSP